MGQVKTGPVKRVAIVGGVRIPFCRSGTNYNHLSNKAIMSEVMTALVRRYSLQGKELGEVALGAVVKHVFEFNLARECTLEAGLSAHTPAFDLQRACGTSLEAAIQIANKIALGQIEVGIAGGCDSNSDVPIELGPKLSHRLVDTSRAKTLMDRLMVWKGFSPSEFRFGLPSIKEPRTNLSMGESCEIMAKTWGISRQEQDALAVKSHQNAEKAYQEGFYQDLVIPFQGLSKDNNIRAKTDMNQLAKLRPSFDPSPAGTLTAGNSSALTDGAAAVLLCSEEYAQKNNLEVQAYLTHCQVAAVDYIQGGKGERGEGLLMAPAYAIPRLLQRANLSFQDFDFYEIHEAFAAQVLCTLKALDSKEFCQEKLGLSSPLGTIDVSKMNVKGGSVAIGHPFAATGARIVANLAKMLSQKQEGGRGLISICTAGGMGVTAILER